MNKSALVFLLTGLAILVALFLLLRPAAEAPPVAAPEVAAASTAETPATEMPVAAATPQPVQVEWIVENGQRISGPERIELRAGDEVVLSVRSDRDDELHVHGYDLHAHLHAGQTATLRFTAAQSGRFECELHKAHLALGVLEVQPR